MTAIAPTAMQPPRLSVLHAAATGAAIVALLLVLSWATAASGAMPQTGTLFGTIDAGSPFALAVACAYAIVRGALIALSIAVSYNAFRFLGAVRSVENP